MLREELNNKTSELLMQEKSNEMYMQTDEMQEKVQQEALRIWEKLKSIFLAMQPARHYKLFFGFEYNTMAIWDSGRYKMYYVRGEDLSFGRNFSRAHQLFFVSSKIRYPDETLEALIKLAESENIECKKCYKDGYVLGVFKRLRGILFSA